MLAEVTSWPGVVGMAISSLTLIAIVWAIAWVMRRD